MSFQQCQSVSFPVIFRTVFLFVSAIFLLGCQKNIEMPPPKPSVSATESSAYFLRNLSPQNQKLYSWRALDPTLQKSIRYVKTKNPTDIAIDRPGLRLTWGQMATTLAELQTLLPHLDANPSLFQERFSWIAVDSGIMYTGYYEPVLKASRTYKEGYQPLYKAPPELAKIRKRGRKYHSRTAIDKENVLAGRGLELAWAESTVDVYYLQIQGSGKLQFEDGSTAYVNYAGQNGHKYVSSGRVMGDMGLLERGDVFEQRAWFAKNPHRIWEIFKENQSYVFFRFGDKGAVGATGHVVDPWVSLAVDRNFIPLGSVIAYGVDIPYYQGGVRPLRGIGFAQDVGGAIKRNRIDIFAGGGKEAEYAASFLDARGPAWVLVSKSVLD